MEARLIPDGTLSPEGNTNEKRVASYPRAAYSNFKSISVSGDWFEGYQVAANLFVFYEPRHYEETIVNLLIGDERAALIDTGCGIGNLREAVGEVTDKPVIVVNTHTSRSSRQ